MKLMESLKTLWIVWMWNHTPNCAEMSRLASQSLEQPLTMKMRLKMWLHFLICVWCERYHKHLKFLHRAAPEFGENVDSVFHPSLSFEAKQRIKVRLQEIDKP